jgi:pimeloyl-ACP methyl ester carboxylesterase
LRHSEISTTRSIGIARAPLDRPRCDMNSIECDGVRLDVEQVGKGRTLVLIHGAWTDRSTWDPVVGDLASEFRVVRYSRRGYGASHPAGCSLSGHVADLRALLRTLGLSQVTLVGNSLGAVIAAQVWLEEPRGPIDKIIIHEPPLLKLLQRSASHHVAWVRLSAILDRTLEAIRAGEYRMAGQLYVEGMASCPGAWQYLPQDLQEDFVRHAPAFLLESAELPHCDIDADALRPLQGGLVITRGERSTAYLRHIVDQLSAALPGARKHIFAGAGHVPHRSSPKAFVEFVRTIVGV